MQVVGVVHVLVPCGPAVSARAGVLDGLRRVPLVEFAAHVAAASAVLRWGRHDFAVVLASGSLDVFAEIAHRCQGAVAAGCLSSFLDLFGW